MKFVKGMMVGTLISAGILMAYSENNGGMNISKKKMMKKGKQMAKKMGIM